MPTLRARRTGFPARYEIVSGDVPVTTVSARTAQHGGELDVGGQAYQLDGSAFGSNCHLLSADGREVASAERTGLRSWNIVAAGRQFRLTRAAFGNRNIELAEGDNRIGRVRKVTRGAEADLPGLDRPIDAFVLIVALAMWQRRRRAVVIAR
ncbi:hypothetical protein [Amycolatopsis anabasis]|uniref:hypothetical protein n=1 Tax=Amycolatopsis anabasis TaxID=1840409 RepID=UPI00131B024D|nr:hypothetical protein [Amycolatopsis anabasis]